MSLSMIRLLDCLTHPVTTDLLDAPTLRCILSLNKRFYDAVVDAPSYWRSVCANYCHYQGLYSARINFRTSANTEAINYKRHFIDEILIYSNKWAEVEGQGDNTTATAPATAGREYRVQVACRFRPGDVDENRFHLPLRQFLRVRRKQQQEQQEKAGQDGSVREEARVVVGRQPPEDFLDPLLGVVMREPVRLATSGRVVDRSLAVQCILRGGRDPFNGRRLSLEALEPLGELQARIDQWRGEQSARDVSVDRAEVGFILAELQGAAGVVDVLRDVERVKALLRRSRQLTRTNNASGDHDDDEGDVNLEQDGAEQHAALAPEVLEEVDIVGTTQGSKPWQRRGGASSTEEGDDGAPTKRRERAKVLSVSAQQAVVTMNVPGQGIRPFYFSAVHDAAASQQTVFASVLLDCVSTVLNGDNACLLCYGQTGSGKTYTFFGAEDLEGAAAIGMHPSTGAVLRAVETLLAGRDSLQRSSAGGGGGVTVTLTAQFVEIYDERVRDLLSGAQVRVRRDTGEVEGAAEAPLGSLEEAQRVVAAGHARKRFAATALNQHSSRSHTAFIVRVTQEVTGTGSGTGVSSRRESQLMLVDLAGSERVKKSRVGGSELREAVRINASLLALGRVISALAEARSHVPYLECKLTTLLKRALGSGSCRTVAVMACRSEAERGDETLQSMRFGESCSLVTHSMQAAARSVESALQAVDEALATTAAQLRTLEGPGGRTQLKSYATLRAAYSELSRRRRELATTANTTSARTQM